MNGYVCYYNSDSVEVHAETSLKAAEAGRELFQKKYPRRKVKGYEVHPYLAEKDGQPVEHVAVD